MSNLRVFDPTFSDSFESAMRRFFSPALLDNDTSALKMRIDVSEKDDAFHVKADLPGVKKEDINISVDGNMVQITAEAKREKETKGDGDKVLRSERYWGNITRTFSLGQEVDDERVNAKYVDGVLTLDLPKKKSAQQTSKKITVQ